MDNGSKIVFMNKTVTIGNIYNQYSSKIMESSLHTINPYLRG